MINPKRARELMHLILNASRYREEKPPFKPVTFFEERFIDKKQEKFQTRYYKTLALLSQGVR